LTNTEIVVVDVEEEQFTRKISKLHAPTKFARQTSNALSYETRFLNIVRKTSAKPSLEIES